MVNCMVVGCGNRSKKDGKKIRFYKFPNDEKTCKLWVKACGKRQKFNTKCARLCSDHFAESDFMLQDILLDVPFEKRRLQSGVVPSQKLPHVKHVTKKETNRIILENKAIVEECIASYERAQAEAILCEEAQTDGLRNQDGYRQRKALGEHSYSHIKYLTNGSTQTDVDYDCCKELHIMKLEAQNRKLMSLLKRQAIRAQENEALRSSLKSFMTIGQINRLTHPGKMSKWRPEDIASAISLYSAGPAAYAHLRKRNFPLPGTSTLRGWACRIEVKPGILKSVLSLLNKSNYDDENRLCVLYFNKIRLRSSTYISNAENAPLAKSKYAYVVMARGFSKDWAHVVYYKFDTPITWAVLKSIILELDKIKFTVIAVVSDMSPAVTSLWEEISVSETKPYIHHPCDEYKKIFFFVDPFHIMKMMRNRFISSGFLLHEKQVDVKPIKAIFECDEGELKLTQAHIEVNKSERRKDQLALELFSPAVSASVKKFINLGKIDHNSGQNCANFIDLISSWLRIFSQKGKLNGSKTEKLVMDLNTQADILAKISKHIRNLKSSKKSISLHFPNGVLLNNSALTQMLSYVTISYAITSSFTDTLNYQELEKFFNTVRSKGNSPEHPTPLEFKYRLRSSLMSKMAL